MTAITILDRQTFNPTLNLWKFFISEADADLIDANHESLRITTSFGVVRPSLTLSPWSEIYSGLTADPYGLYWALQDNGGDGWSINFITPIGNSYFTDINSWTTFQLDIDNPSLPNYTGIRECLTRSPQFVTITSDDFDSATYNIKLYEDELFNYTLYPLDYTKTKQKVVSDQILTYIDISNIAKQGMEASMNGRYPVTNTTNALPLNVGESKFVKVDFETNLLGVSQQSGTVVYIALDGYREKYETMSEIWDKKIIPNVLLSGNRRMIEKSCTFRVHYKTENLVSITRTADDGTTTYTINDATTTNERNNEYIKSFKVDTSGKFCTYTFDYGATQETVYFYFYEECKYKPYYIVFKNKWGVTETICAGKKSTDETNIKSSEYRRSIVNYNAFSNQIRHTNKQYNVNGSDSIVLNTDFLPEYMNTPIKELMLSEEVWVGSGLEACFPVTKEDSNFRFKTNVNDKLIQYTFRFKLSHDSINNRY
jgi:hypothetical protein